MKKPLAALLLSLLLLPGSVQTAAQPGMQLMKFSNPVFAPPSDLISFLEMENNTNDTQGNYTWINQSTVAFSGVIYKNGSYSALFDSTDTDECIKSDGNVSESIRTVFFWFYWPTGHDDTDTWVFNDGIYSGMQAESGAIRIIISGTWSTTYALSDDTWYDIACQYNDDSKMKLYVGGIERKSVSKTDVPANSVWYFGNTSTQNKPIDGYLDDVKIYTSLVN